MEYPIYYLIPPYPTLAVVLPPFSASSKLRSALCDSVRKWQSTSPLPDISRSFPEHISSLKKNFPPPLKNSPNIQYLLQFLLLFGSVLSPIMAERVRGGEDGEMGGDPAVSAAAVSSCLRMVQRLAQLYRDLPSFAELFSSVSFNLQQLVRTSESVKK